MLRSGGRSERMGITMNLTSLHGGSGRGRQEEGGGEEGVGRFAVWRDGGPVPSASAPNWAALNSRSRSDGGHSHPLIAAKLTSPDTRGMLLVWIDVTSAVEALRMSSSYVPGVMRRYRRRLAGFIQRYSSWIIASGHPDA